MKYQVEPHPLTEATGQTAYVLGARQGSGNIGDAVVHKLARAGWVALGDDAARGDGSRPPGGNIPNEQTARAHGYEPNDKGLYQRYEAPSVQDLYQADADALVVTLGTTYKEHFTEIADWEISRVIRANLILPLEAVRRYVQATGSGDHGDAPKRIILIGSYAHDHPFTNGTLYCAAKAGLDMAARCLGWELTDRGFRVNIIHPYHVIGTPMWEDVQRGVMESKQMTREEADAYAEKDLKMPRPLSAEDVAAVVKTLLTEDAFDWTSGQAINLYGGSR